MEKLFVVKGPIKIQTCGEHQIKGLAIKLIVKTSERYMATQEKKKKKNLSISQSLSRKIITDLVK